MDPEAARWRRRTMFLLSVVLHGLLAVVILVSPDLFRRGAQMMGIQIERAPQPEATILWFPPDLLKRLEEPPPDSNVLSDRNRRAQGHSPLVDPFGSRNPYSPGNTPLPEIAGGAPPTPPPVVAAPPPGSGGDSTPGPPPPPETKEESQLQLLDVPPASGGGAGRIPVPTASEAIQQSIEAVGRSRPRSAQQGPGDSPAQFRNLNPNFSTDGPIILSDTLGVDFGPYLARVVYNVKRNWYAVIPETARLGQKGRVSIVFEILKDGSVPELRLVASSGSDPLDRAALASIRASNPFPPLPDEFTGQHLVLQFIFLYNLGYGY